MLHDFFYRMELQKELKISETIDSLRIDIEPNQPMQTFVEELFNELKSIPVRDSFELFFDISGNQVAISNTSDSSYKKLINHICDNDVDDPYEIGIKIRKNILDSTVSIYFFDTFVNYVLSEKLTNIFITLAKILNEKLLFEVFSKTKNFYSNSMFFFQSGTQIITSCFTGVKDRNTRVEMLKENVNFSGFDIKILPDDFNLEVKSENGLLNDFFCRAKAVLSLISISSSSGFIENEKFKYKINGYKTVCCDAIDYNELAGSCETLYRIYSWTYEGGNNIDKIGLVRNVLSIHLDSNGQIKFDNDAWEAIQSNYQIYLKENIESYLEVKNKIGELVIDSISKTYAMADELLDSLKNNALAIITFIMTVVLVDGFKDNGFTTIFSTKYLIVVLIISILSLIWLIMIKTETINKFNFATNTIKSVLILNYSKVIMENEINSIVDPIVQKNKDYLYGLVKKYSCWWYSLLLVFSSIFIIANCVLDEQPPQSQQTQTSKPS